MTRPFNFSAGPATMPAEVLAQAAAEMLDWHGSGMGVMEMSHRGREFVSIYEQAEADLRELLAVPAHFKILFMQGGGLAENAIVPLNLAGRRSGAGSAGPIDVVVTGSWSQKSLKEAARFGSVNLVASNEADGHTRLPEPASWRLSPDAAYVHICSNETIHGVEFHELPDLRALGCDAPLVVDFSSHAASRPVDWSRVGLAFAGAQKNLGPAGLTLVVVREDLIGHALPACPSAFDYRNVADAGSMFNTPPTYAIYMAGLVFQWLKRQGGITAIEALNRAKAGGDQNGQLGELGTQGAFEADVRAHFLQMVAQLRAAQEHIERAAQGGVGAVGCRAGHRRARARTDGRCEFALRGCHGLVVQQRKTPPIAVCCG